MKWKMRNEMKREFQRNERDLILISRIMRASFVHDKLKEDASKSEWKSFIFLFFLASTLSIPLFQFGREKKVCCEVSFHHFQCRSKTIWTKIKRKTGINFEQAVFRFIDERFRISGQSSATKSIFIKLNWFSLN